MNRKMVLVVFLVLSITPFMRGCAESIGFPVPAMENVLVAGDPGKTIIDFFKEFKSLDTCIIVIANLLTAYLLARVFSRNKDKFKWIPYFLWTLAANIAIVWSFVLILICEKSSKAEEAVKSIGEKALDVYGAITGTYIFWVPEHLTDWLARINPYKMKVQRGMFTVDLAEQFIEDVLGRVWIILSAVIISGIVYLAHKRLTKATRTPKRGGA